MQDRKRRLLWHGMFLFLLGLLTGLIQANLKNPRMGLSAHLEGVMNGTFLIAFGAIWSEVRLSSSKEALTYWAVLYGTYGNWAATTLAAILGTAAMTPISAAGYGAQPWQEALITASFVSVGLAIVTASILALWGLRPAPSSGHVK